LRLAVAAEDELGHFGSLSLGLAGL